MIALLAVLNPGPSVIQGRTWGQMVLAEWTHRITEMVDAVIILFADRTLLMNLVIQLTSIHHFRLQRTFHQMTLLQEGVHLNLVTITDTTSLLAHLVVLGGATAEDRLIAGNKCFPVSTVTSCNIGSLR